MFSKNRKIVRGGDGDDECGMCRFQVVASAAVREVEGVGSVDGGVMCREYESVGDGGGLRTDEERRERGWGRAVCCFFLGVGGGSLGGGWRWERSNFGIV